MAPAAAANLDPASDEFVQALARGLAVICVFGEGAEELSLSQVASRAGLTRAGARRLLLTLKRLGYVGQRERAFFLTPHILELGYAYLSSMPLWRFAEPILEELATSLEETCSVAVLDGTESVYLLRMGTARLLRPGVSVGSRLPAYATSMGRILLGGLSPPELDQYFARAKFTRYTARTVIDQKSLRRIIGEDRERGWSYVSGELDESIHGLAVPIVARDGRVIAAMNASASTRRVTKADVLKRFLPALRNAARKVNAQLAVRR